MLRQLTEQATSDSHEEIKTISIEHRSEIPRNPPLRGSSRKSSQPFCRESADSSTVTKTTKRNDGTPSRTTAIGATGIVLPCFHNCRLQRRRLVLRQFLRSSSETSEARLAVCGDTGTFRRLPFLSPSYCSVLDKCTPRTRCQLGQPRG